MQHNLATRKARIATALAVMVLVLAAPTAAADNEPEVQDDGSATAGPCAGVDPWQIPPGFYLDIDACLEPL